MKYNKMIIILGGRGYGKNCQSSLIKHLKYAFFPVFFLNLIPNSSINYNPLLF